MPRLLAIVRGPAVGLLAFSASLVGFHLSEFVPTLPVDESTAAMRAALLDEPPPIPDSEAVVAMEATHWYRQAALPALTGILIGVLVSPWSKLSALDALTATATYFLVHVILFGVAGAETWIGFASFLCALVGANRLVRDVARAAMSKRVSAQRPG